MTDSDFVVQLADVSSKPTTICKDIYNPPALQVTIFTTLHFLCNLQYLDRISTVKQAVMLMT